MQYDFVPMPDRKPLKWPGGAEGKTGRDDS